VKKLSIGRRMKLQQEERKIIERGHLQMGPAEKKRAWETEQLTKKKRGGCLAPGVAGRRMEEEIPRKMGGQGKKRKRNLGRIQTWAT